MDGVVSWGLSIFEGLDGLCELGQGQGLVIGQLTDLTVNLLGKSLFLWDVTFSTRRC